MITLTIHPQPMLVASDVLLTIAHLLLIGFNLTGWMFLKTRKAHLITLISTAGSWFILGIWYGIGYCPLTDWQWRVKEKLGEHSLPASFIKYFADKVSGEHFSPIFIDRITLIFFIAVVACTLSVNLPLKKRKYRIN